MIMCPTCVTEKMLSQQLEKAAFRQKLNSRPIYIIAEALLGLSTKCHEWLQNRPTYNNAYAKSPKTKTQLLLTCPRNVDQVSFCKYGAILVTFLCLRECL